MFCVASSYSSSVMDPYKTFRIQPGASESEVRKPSSLSPGTLASLLCSSLFRQISQTNEAYGIVMSRLREEPLIEEMPEKVPEEPMYAPDYELWEKWIGWEGDKELKWIGWDYTSHNNPYI
ncbi:hypothetical protein LINGRAHAP2_LOCUS9915 [Linum grandiflorum]